MVKTVKPAKAKHEPSKKTKGTIKKAKQEKKTLQKKSVKCAKKERYCILVRHGERCDLVEKFKHLDKNGKGDSPLTPNGLK